MGFTYITQGKPPFILGMGKFTTETYFAMKFTRRPGT